MKAENLEQEDKTGGWQEQCKERCEEESFSGIEMWIHETS